MMMKIILSLALYTSIVLSFQGNCPCGIKHAFNQDTYTCEQYPSPSQEGYVNQCKSYTVQGINQLQWKCLSCESQYILSQGTCVDTGIPGCVAAKKIQNPSNQVEFLSSNGQQKYQCIACDLHHYEYDYKCVEFPKKGDKNYMQGCETYLSQGKCLFCEQGYVREQYYCKQVKHKIPNCNAYEDIHNCFNCEKGYVLNHNQCIKPEKIIANCLAAQNINGRIYCYVCNPGYFLIYKICQPFPGPGEGGFVDNCSIYGFNDKNGNLECQQCNNSYSLAMDRQKQKCEKLEENTTKNCYKYLTNQYDEQECQGCIDGYNPQFQDTDIIECKKCPKNPEIYQNLQQNTVQNHDGFAEILQDI